MHSVTYNAHELIDYYLVCLYMTYGYEHECMCALNMMISKNSAVTC